VPVQWADSPDSRVRIAATILGDLRGIWRLWWGLGLGSMNVPAVPIVGVADVGVRLDQTI
jgi:hypothetical protein